MDWFLYDNGLRLERVNRYRHSNNILNAFLAYVPFFLHSRKTRRPKVRSLGIKRKQWPEMCWITHFVSSIQKTAGFLMFSRGWRKRPVAWNGLIKLSNRDILVASVLSQNLDLDSKDSLNQTVRPSPTRGCVSQQNLWIRYIQMKLQFGILITVLSVSRIQIIWICCLNIWRNIR